MKFLIGPKSMGLRAVFLVDDCGCLLHTEPVCTIAEGWHVWFAEHLKAADPKVMGAPYFPLLEHPCGKWAAKTAKPRPD